MAPLEQVTDAFRTIDADPATKDKALHYLREWLTDAAFAAYRPQVEWLIQQQQWSGLLDRFYQVLPFGTGGRRGAVGIGPNRMNLWTLGASVQGHCEYLKERFPDARELHVALAYDVRRFMDKNKNYNPALPNPILGLSSRDFAQHAGSIYIANGIHVHILPNDSTRYLATPELSFTIRHLKCHGGLNISASHNPPDDNGGKFYDERGGQPVPPDDQIMSDLVEQVGVIRSIPWADATRSGKVHFLDESSHRAYIDLCRKQSLVAPPKFDEIRVVFTPLHGVGGTQAMEVLELAGFRPIPVPEQMTPDGQFPNVTKSPNPEVPESLDRAIALAKERKADLVLATDPDADRIGGASADGAGRFRVLTGNQICSLLTHFKLSRLAAQGRMPPSPIVVTTEVTTRLVTRIGRQFGAQVINNLLVGFKYIAEVLWQLEQTGSYEDVRGTPADFIIGTEESHGVMAMPQVRDKDAAAAALLLAELALDCKRHGLTVGQHLDRLYREFGYFKNALENIVMTGIEGKQDMANMLDRLRRQPPKAVAGLAVTKFEDLRDEAGRFGPLKGATDAASRNVLLFQLGEQARIALRPSGTEPKAKAYVEACSPPCPAGTPPEAWRRACQTVDDTAKAVAAEFKRLALEGIAKSAN
ncbi:MAG: phospho-sugar mutase [Gemmataceae bacterium]